MRSLWEIFKSKYVIILTLFTLILLGVSFVKSWREDHRMVGLLQDKGALTTYKLLKGAYQDQLGPVHGLKRTKTGDVKPISFSTVDAREGGSDVCVCPICKVVFLHKKGCGVEARCPKCHRHLLSGLYAGSGYLKTASASDAQLKFVIGPGNQQNPSISDGNRQNLKSNVDQQNRTFGTAGQQDSQIVAKGQLGPSVPDVTGGGGQQNQEAAAAHSIVAGGELPATAAAPEGGQQNIPPINGEIANSATSPVGTGTAQEPPAVKTDNGNIGTK